MGGKSRCVYPSFHLSLPLKSCLSQLARSASYLNRRRKSSRQRQERRGRSFSRIEDGGPRQGVSHRACCTNLATLHCSTPLARDLVLVCRDFGSLEAERLFASASSSASGPGVEHILVRPSHSFLDELRASFFCLTRPLTHLTLSHPVLQLACCFSALASLRASGRCEGDSMIGTGQGEQANTSQEKIQWGEATTLETSSTAVLRRTPRSRFAIV